MSRSWYAYDGSGSPCSVDNYLAMSTAPNYPCFSGRILCAVYARDRFPKQITPQSISTNLCYYIADGLASGGPAPVAPVGAKKYVYFFPQM